jgi:Zn-dependent membrane protease YugP
MVHTLEHTQENPHQIRDEHLRAVVMRRSAVIYLSITAGMALLFFLIAYLIGGYPPVAKVGGMMWVGLLSLIITMPLVTDRVKKKLSKS